ncbi:MAG TPA: hypothetical protein VEB86_15485 [Chryseosolibacter sp.]|nr:hypothetical protein [Chryseosolibacter sp.]
MKYPIVLLIVACVITSCSEDVEVKPFTYSKVFTGENEKTWIIEQIAVKKQGTPDQYFQLDLCERDDRYTFFANEERAYTISNGALKCFSDEEDVYVEHTWSFVNAGAVLNIAIPRVFGNFVVPFIVTKATKTEMVLEIFANAENTISYEITMKSISEK